MEEQQHPPEDHTVVAALLLRLWWAHYLIRVDCKPRQDRCNEFRWQLFIDTHIELCAYILTHGSFRDTVLLDPDYNTLQPLVHIVDTLYPHDIRFYYSGELPDLTPCLDYGNLWFDMRPRTDTLLSALVHIFICKPQSQKCQVRNFIRILLRYFKAYPVMVILLRMIIRVSLLGNYPFCTYRPSFKRRMEIYRSFEQLRINNDLFLWMVENECVVYMMTKEFYSYLVCEQYVLDIVLSKTGQWQEVKKLTQESMDTMRLMLDTLNGYERHIRITEELQERHNESLHYISKLRKGNFPDIVLALMTKIHERNQTANVLRADDFHRFVPENIRQYLELVAGVVADNTSGYVELRWLKCVGITDDGYERIRSLYFEYEQLDIADNALERHLLRIYEGCTNDFYLIMYYLKAIVTIYAEREYPLPLSCLLNQVQALRMRLRLLPWEELSAETDDLYYYCKSCGKWACPMVDTASPKGALNVYARGCDKALRDHQTGDLYCGKQSSSAVTAAGASSKGSGGRHQQQPAALNRQVKVNRKHREVTACVDTKLTPVHMLGKVKRVDGKFAVLCECCAAMMEYNQSKFSSQGMTCSHHRRDPVISEVHATISQTIIDRSDRLERARMELGISAEQRYTERCWYCGKDRESIQHEQNTKPIIMTLLNDDDSRRIVYETVLICDRDFHGIADMAAEMVPLRKSVAKETITQHSIRRAMWHGRISYPRTTKFAT